MPLFLFLCVDNFKSKYDRIVIYNYCTVLKLCVCVTVRAKINIVAMMRDDVCLPTKQWSTQMFRYDV